MSSYTADMICDNAADKVGMLLSTDWFQPHWDVIGINATLDSKRCVQEKCRDIVNQMVGPAEEYWLISFSPDRVRATREAVLALARECGLDAASAERLNELCKERAERQERERVAWLFRTVSLELLSDDELTPEIKLAVGHASIMFEFDGDLHALSTESKSAWDRRIRRLTPDLPGYLSDWISVGVLAEAALNHVLTCLNKEQQQLLRRQFKAAAVRATGLDEAVLPDCW